ncbi:hypothetical protein [Paenibacillus sp. NPDC058071]|uniref:hypothetical protein n=1 Tax=Paenibacillus sp. NPDC058071 TaxID=3346326 RepID=UPI0036D900DE
MKPTWPNRIGGITVCLVLLFSGTINATPTASASQEGSPREMEVKPVVVPLNAIALQVKWPQSLDDDEAAKSWRFDGGLEVRQPPLRMTGSASTYLVPTTVQEAGKTYRLSYPGGEPVSFTSNAEPVAFWSVKQTAYDTVELISDLEEGVTDYHNVVQKYAGKRNGLDFTLAENNKRGERPFAIIPSLRGLSITLTPAKGESVKAYYVPFTQATDGRQAPKFRLPEGQELTPGMKYRVFADWATIRKAELRGKSIKPLAVVAARPIDERTLVLHLKLDPKDEATASRELRLTDPAGAMIKARYRPHSRYGPIVLFDLAPGARMEPNISYKLTQLGKWASFHSIAPVRLSDAAEMGEDG